MSNVLKELAAHVQGMKDEIQRQASRIVALEAQTADPDTKPRDPGCQCHLEEGDSPCPVHGDECARCRYADGCQRAESAEAVLSAVREVVQHMADSVAAARTARGPQTGMHMPYHGDFAGANPTTLREIYRSVNHLLDLLRARGRQ